MIIDDDADARYHLDMLVQRSEVARVISEATNVAEAMEALQHVKPDVIFLDIEMPGVNGLEFARRYRSGAAIIFVSGHPAYAVEAWDSEAVDFLQKPIDERKLLRALRNAASGVRGGSDASAATDPLVRERAEGPPNIAVTKKCATKFYPISMITRFYVNDGLTVFKVGESEESVDLTLDMLEERLRDFGFQRTHRAELLNVRHVVEVSRGNRAGATARLRDGQTATVSKRNVGALMAGLNLLNARAKT